MELSYASSPLVPFSPRAKYTPPRFQSFPRDENRINYHKRTHIPYRSLILFSPIFFVVADSNGAPNHHTSSPHPRCHKSSTGYVQVHTISSTSTSIRTRPGTHLLKADVSHHYCHDPYKGLVTLSDHPHSTTRDAYALGSPPPQSTSSYKQTHATRATPCTVNHWTVLAGD